MKILFLSDTHSQHRKLKNLPEADMVIHAGDVSKTGRDHEVEDFMRWFSALDYKYKVFIAGNHDFFQTGSAGIPGNKSYHSGYAWTCGFFCRDGTYLAGSGLCSAFD